MQPTPDISDSNRRDVLKPGNRFLGRVVACNGSHATISAVVAAGDTSLSELWAVGRLVSISVNDSRIAALVYSMNTQTKAWSEHSDNVMLVEVELVGEITSGPDGQSMFHSGIRNHPYLGAIAHRMRASDLAAIYETRGGNPVVIGRLAQDERMDATISMATMLERHFAVVGTTGVGKSTAVSLLINKAIAAEPRLRVLILDPHNEFAAAFPDTSVVIDPETLDLPFWLFRLEEFVEVLYKGRTPIPEEVDFLYDLLPEAKRLFRGGEGGAIKRRGGENTAITVDTPIPFRMVDLLALIDDRLGRLEGRDSKPSLRNLKFRLQSAVNDPRFRFMFAGAVGDQMTDILGRIFRIPGNGRPVTTFQLAGIPSEVVNAVAAVLCRLAFEIGVWANGAVRLLVLCEEAHRYIPSDPDLGFGPTRQAIARIAKEGRKYGVGLGVITQRPAELDATILSQCSSVFAMRLTNELDQGLIRSAISASSESSISFLSSLDNGEAIAFGEAIAVPMRMRFERLADSALPRAAGRETEMHRRPELNDLDGIVRRMRNLSPSDDLLSPRPSALADLAAASGRGPVAGRPLTDIDDDLPPGFLALPVRRPGDDAPPPKSFRPAPDLRREAGPRETGDGERPAPSIRQSIFGRPPGSNGR
nr:DUF87 domain-containing protein [Methylobrevis albus]